MSNLNTAATETEITTVVPGKYGAAGMHSHLCKVTYRIENAGMPWQRTLIIGRPYPLCSCNYGAQPTAHSLRIGTPVTRETVTCEKCREFAGYFEKP